MRDFLNQIRQALNQNLYSVALSMCLTIPSICGAIDSSDGQDTKAKYVQWYDQNVSSMCQFFDGQACYFFRCSMLHQGSTMNPNSRFSRIIFLEPGTTNNFMHCNVMNNALNLDVRVFCTAVIDSADRWLNRVINTPLFQTNYDKFMRRYPNGLPPYIVGTPVIG